MTEEGFFGFFGGLLVFTSVAIWHSTHFQKSQKIFLTICILFPPAQWVFAIIIYAYNKYNKGNDTLIDYKQDISSKDLEKLKYLKNSKILSDEEYDIKASKIKTESILNDIKMTDEYKALYQLNKRGILNDKEFDEKIKLLSEKQTSYNNDPTPIRLDKDLNPVEMDSKWGYMNKKGTLTIPYIYSGAYDFSEGIALVYITKNKIDYYGFIDKKGNEVISLQYEFGETFSHGLALVRKNRKFGYINMKGEITIPFNYDDADSFEDEKARVKIKNFQFYIDKAGNEI